MVQFTQFLRIALVFMIAMCMMSCTRQVQSSTSDAEPPVVEGEGSESVSAEEVEPTDVKDERFASIDRESVPVDTESERTTRNDLKRMWWESTEALIERLPEGAVRQLTEEVFSFVDEYGYLVAAIGTFQVVAIEPPPEGDRFIGLLFVTEGDLQHDQMLQERVQSGTRVAEYWQNPGMIILYQDHYSEIWQAIALLHEAWHARSSYLTPHNPEDIREFAIEEVQAHEFENSLLLLVGGDAYETILFEEVARIEQVISQTPTKEGLIPLVDMTEYDPRLDTVFGPALSETEQLYRQTHVWLHAQFIVTDRRLATASAEEILEAKALLYHSIREM